MNTIENAKAISDLSIEFERIIYAANFMLLKDDPRFGTISQGLFSYVIPTSDHTETRIIVLSDWHTEKYTIIVEDTGLNGSFNSQPNPDALSFKAEVTMDVIKELPENLYDVVKNNCRKKDTHNLVRQSEMKEIAKVIHYRISNDLMKLQSYKYDQALSQRVRAYREQLRSEQFCKAS